MGSYDYFTNKHDMALHQKTGISYCPEIRYGSQVSIAPLPISAQGCFG